MARTVMITLCIGNNYRFMWERHCRANWQAYAQRHGYDLIAHDQLLDQSPFAKARSPAWQKCLILEALKQYERVVWLDADIVINPNSPPIVEGVPPGKVGGVISGSYFQPNERGLFLSRVRKLDPTPVDVEKAWRDDQASFYRKVGVNCITHDIVQTGVLVLDASHREMFLKIYNAYPSDLPSFEQLPLSAEILNRGLFHSLDFRFNAVFPDLAVVRYPYLFDPRTPDLKQRARTAVVTELQNSYFLHFAGSQNFMSCLA